MYVAVLGALEHDTSKIVKTLAGVDYQVTVFSDEEALLESLTLVPPHIVVYDVESQPPEAPYGLVQRIRVLSPETQFVLLKPQLHSLPGQVGIDIIYDIVTRPVISEEVLRAVDRITDSLILKYRIEDLRGELTQSKFSMEARRADFRTQESTESLEVSLSSDHIQALFAAVGEKRDLTSIVQIYCDQVSGFLDDSPVVFFKYMKYKFSLAVSAAAQIPFEKVRGVGLKFRGISPQAQKEILLQPEKATQLANLIQRAFAQEEFYATPLIYGSEVAGVFVFLARDLKPEQTQLVRFLTNLLELVYYRNSLELRLHNLNVYDEVTLVFKRKFFDERLGQEVIRAKRTELPLSVVRIEVDQHAHYTEKFGVVTSDIILQMIAVILRNTSRGADIVARSGRGEFSLILPYTNAHGAAVRAEHLRRAVEAARFPGLEEILEGPVTLSVGVSELPSIGEDGETIFRQAGEALDQVRDIGGNKVCLAVCSPGYQPEFKVKV
jgi:diguanylate cyclase (GGDEF)-like protein